MAAETFRIEIPINVKDNTEPGVGQATRKINAFDKANEKTQERLDKMNRTKYQVVVDALDKASGVLNRIGTTVKGIAGKAWKVTLKAVDFATAPIRGIINILKNPIFQIGATIGITVGLKDTIDTFASFEATMSKVKAISGATAGEFEALNAKAKEMGATTKFTASEAGDAFTYMAMAGWDAEKMLGGISGIMSLAAADGLDLATTSDIVTDAITAFGLQASDSSRFADVLATASSSANTNVSMLGESFKYVAPLAGAMKYSVEDVSLALGLMANASVKGSMAGTSLKTALANMAAPTDSMAKVMKKYNISLTDTDGNMKSLRGVLSNVRAEFRKLGEAEQTAATKTLFGREAMAGMLAIINASQEDYDKLVEAIDNADGAAERMAATMLDNLSGSFTLLQSAAEGVKITIGERLKPHIMSFTSWLTGKMPDIERAAGRAMDFIDDKIAGLSKNIKSLTESEAWSSADTWGKVKLSWEKIIAEPFNEWWSSTGKTWLADKASKIGEGIGTALSAGLLTLLGVDAKGAIEDGISIGASFAEGFSKGFDGKKVGEGILKAIKGIFKDAGTLMPGGEKASSTSWLSAGAIALALSKLGIFKLIGKGGKGLINLFGKGSKDGTPGGGELFPDTFTTSVMHVSATAVYINGNTIQNPNIRVPGGGGMTPGGSTPPILPPAGGGPASLPPSSPTLALPGAAGAAGKAINTVQLSNGTYVATGGALTTGLASTGVALGSGATTAGGAVAAGTSGILGGILGILGLGAGAVDIYQGTKKTGKEAKDEYWQGGTKIGMVGTGAAAGAAIGSVVPVIGTGVGALAGAGIGGATALFTGDKAGKALSDATDEGGGLSRFWENTKEWAGDTWDAIKTGASDAGTWISDKWSGFSDWFDSSVWTPTKDLGISAINIASGIWQDASGWISEKWVPVAEWFDETVWEPVKSAAQTATDWVGEKWGAAKEWIGEKWADLSEWFDETIWEPVKEGAAIAGDWVGEKWDGVKEWVSETWGTVSDWFGETVWEPVKEAAEVSGDWIGDQFDAAKSAVSNAWEGLSGWFDNNVWGPIKSGASTAWGWLSDKFSGWGKKGSEATGLTTSRGKGSVLEHAWGGIMTKPHMGIVAEDGAEGIIPLSPSKRNRGIDLWQRTGEILGVQPYANGGITGDEPEQLPKEVPTGGGQNITIKVEVKAEPKFTIEGDGDITDENKVLAVLKEYIREMTDDIGDELAERLARIFANMPVKGGAKA